MATQVSNFVVSARKYRPAHFNSVVGQRVITTTLQQAIARQQLAHAYLFCGPRGVGKTTCARIFAKTINCQHPTAQMEACDECDSCKQFLTGRSLNVHELDAASNNSVEDIRALIEQVQSQPMGGKYSVFIIDEVHMLSQAAFNAFLKTLEEPPDYAIFILATTEKHKILPTILSRCQIFDFHRIRVDDTIEFLQQIATKEGVTCEKEALNLIALRADGAMRDALSAFDQVVSFSQGQLTYENTIKALNVLDVNLYFKLMDLVAHGDYKAALLLLDEVIAKGFDLNQFLIGLSEHIRNLLLAFDEQTCAILEVGESFAQKYRQSAHGLDIRLLTRSLLFLTEALATYRTAANARLLVEVLLITLCQLPEELGIKA